jgi:uncharacterized protein YlxW (UPF0749 family)
MSGGQWMAVLIVAIVMVASILKTRAYGAHRDGEDSGNSVENERLREEVKQLKERLQVLERIATDRENSLSREIDELRDR